jgi:hypothetical protein
VNAQCVGYWVNNRIGQPTYNAAYAAQQAGKKSRPATWRDVLLIKRRAFITAKIKPRLKFGQLFNGNASGLRRFFTRHPT